MVLCAVHNCTPVCGNPESTLPPQQRKYAFDIVEPPNYFLEFKGIENHSLIQKAVEEIQWWRSQNNLKVQ